MKTSIRINKNGDKICTIKTCGKYKSLFLINQVPYCRLHKNQLLDSTLTDGVTFNIKKMPSRKTNNLIAYLQDLDEMDYRVPEEDIEKMLACIGKSDIDNIVIGCISNVFN
jgi:hypothetical protein